MNKRYKSRRHNLGQNIRTSITPVVVPGRFIPTFISISIIYLISVAFSIVNAQTVIEENEVEGKWTLSKSPYVVQQDIEIPAGSELAIEAGTEVLFTGKYKLTVKGKLVAEGTEELPIIFSVPDSITEKKNMWMGIKLTTNTSDTSKLAWCNIMNVDATGSSIENSLGGALAVIDYHYLKMEYVDITKNTALLGAGVYIKNSTAKLEYCKINNNTAISEGGGIYVSGSELMLKNSLITNNTAFNTGGGISSSKMEGYWFNNIISDNKAKFGAGLAFKEDKSTLINNTISNNEAEINGGAVHMKNSSTRFINSIFWGNYAPGKENQGYLFQKSNPTFWYCNIQGGSEGFEVFSGYGSYIEETLYSLDEDPRFITNDTLYYGLDEMSPCVDAGLSMLDDIDLPASDNSGRYRINNDVIDMGANEYGASLLPEFIKELEEEESLQEDANLQLVTFPNPSDGEFRVVITEAEDSEYSLRVNAANGYGMFNKDIYRSGSVTVVSVNMDASPGIYVLTLTNSKGRIVKESKVMVKGKAYTSKYNY